MPVKQAIENPQLSISASISKGASGGDVRLIQEWLVLNGFQLVVDGKYGAATTASVERYQQRLGLKVTGIVDKVTFSSLTQPIKLALVPINGDGLTLNALLVRYARQHLSQHPREVGGQNKGPWVRLYMHGNEGVSQPWCAGFVSYCLNQAASSANQKSPLPDTPSCDVLANAAIQAGKLVAGKTAKATPEKFAGGVFLVKGTTPGDWTHTGIVTDATKTVIHTIEGNTNDDGSREGYEVCARTRSYDHIDLISLA